ncbi:tripartite tricarboxylate transporter TctB family protein [Psychrobacillus insolitus]|uniref:Tripartite tricarboxylate transporter TctB family protein n=1 Tax=Psychrobacillus insolitus TaxID=1461 RepID=A0A2W7MC47_9BACI|nr:tripartite tricarboxylate transporter TctB family protein [Psychrobacillus insolitus]PZX02342.1 tripartite tricarboxylate transporter TctB family protein [Psychrobacillus insolitus]
MNSVKPSVWAGIIILCLGIVSLLMSLQYTYSGMVGPGPGFFPVWLSGIIIVLAIWYILESIKGKNVSAQDWPTGQSLKQILFIIMSLISYFILFLLVGFLLAAIIFLAILFYREYKWYVTVSLSVGITLFIYVMFNTVLKVHLPSGGILF